VEEAENADCHIFGVQTGFGKAYTLLVTASRRWVAIGGYWWLLVLDSSISSHTTRCCGVLLSTFLLFARLRISARRRPSGTFWPLRLDGAIEIHDSGEDTKSSRARNAAAMKRKKLSCYDTLPLGFVHSV